MRVPFLLYTAAIIGATLPCRAQQPDRPASSDQRILVEMYTGSWCGPCVANAEKTEKLRAQYGERVIPVSVHIDADWDMMATSACDSLMGIFWIHGVPTERSNRAMEGMVVPIQPAIVEISIDQTYNTSTLELSATVMARFLEHPTPGDMRLHLFVVEDSVRGIQLNGYNNTASSPYYGKGDHIIGYAHRNVLRAVPSGVRGTAGVIPTEPAIGTTYQQTYRYTLPPDHDPARTRLVAFVSYASAWPPAAATSAGVLNATEVPLAASTMDVPGAPASTLSFTVAPMPMTATGRLHLALPSPEHVTIDLADLTGRHIRTVARESMEAGEHAIPLDVADLPGGAYSLLIRAGHTVTSRIIIVAR